jgi:hypothetical protein
MQQIVTNSERGKREDPNTLNKHRRRLPIQKTALLAGDYKI